MTSTVNWMKILKEEVCKEMLSITCYPITDKDVNYKFDRAAKKASKRIKKQMEKDK
jgi:hypothetical protein